MITTPDIEEYKQACASKKDWEKKFWDRAVEIQKIILDCFGFTAEQFRPGDINDYDRGVFDEIDNVTERTHLGFYPMNHIWAAKSDAFKTDKINYMECFPNIFMRMNDHDISMAISEDIRATKLRQVDDMKKSLTPEQLAHLKRTIFQ